MTRLTWDDATRQTYTSRLQGLVLMDTLEGPAMVVDLWSDGGQVAVVVSVRKGISRDTAEPFLPDWDLLAWEVEPATTAGERFLVAAEQGHLRARERLTGETGLVVLPR